MPRYSSMPNMEVKAKPTSQIPKQISDALAMSEDVMLGT
jgi:hypothetical protein